MQFQRRWRPIEFVVDQARRPLHDASGWLRSHHGRERLAPESLGPWRCNQQSFVGFCHLWTTMFIVGYSFLPMCFAMVIAGNAVKLNVSQFKNQKADKITRIIAIALGAIGIILAIIIGQFI